MTLARKEQFDVLRAHWSVYTYTATAGTTSTTLPGAFLLASVTREDGGNASTTPPVRGIVTEGTNNFVKLRKASDALTLDDAGAQIFGRLTFAAGNYTVTYLKVSGSSEVSATLPGAGSYSITMIFPEVMRFGEVPTNSEILFAQNSELVTTGSSISGDLVVLGNTTLGDASSDTLTFNARLASHFTPSADNLRILGSSTLRFADSNFTQYTARSDATDTIKSIFTAAGFSFSGTPFTIDGVNVLSLGNSLATQVVIGRTGINVDIDGILNVAGAGSIDGNLTVNGLSSVFNGNLNVTGTITASGLSFTDLTIDGNTVLGDSSADTLTINAGLSSNLEPSTDNTYSLGDSSSKYLFGHFLNVLAEDFDGYSDIYLGATYATDIVIGSASAIVTLNSPLTVVALAGESIDNGELVCLDDDAGNPRCFKAQADGYGDRTLVVGVACNSVTIGQEIKIGIAGEKSIPDTEWDSIPTTANVGSLAYLSAIGGNWTLTPPTDPNTNVQKCGIVSRGGTGAVKVIVQIGDSFIN